MITSKTDTHKIHWLDAWHVNPSFNREFEFIDGLRGLAILMVLVDHHLYVNPDSGNLMHFLGALAGQGGGGVKIFFILSGFLISWPFWKRKFNQSKEIILGNYVRRRFWKVYPPLVFSVLLLTPGYIFLKQDWSYLSTAFQWIAGIPFILPVDGRFNPVMWTLVVEVQFYIVLPLVFLCCRSLSGRISLWIIPLGFAVIPTLFEIITGKSANFAPDINVHFPSALYAFSLGVLIAGLDCGGITKKSWANLAWVGVFLWPILVISFAWLNLHPAPFGSMPEIATGWCECVASAFLLLLVANPQHKLAQILGVSWLRWCGIISYEWYLIHQPIILWDREIFGPAGGDTLRYIGIVGGSLLMSGFLAALIFRFYSLPILKYGRTSSDAGRILSNKKSSS